MPVLAPDVSAAAAYGTKFAKGIIGKFWSKLTEQGITVYPNIKGPTKFGKGSATAALKPYDGTYSPEGNIVFTDRELTPTLATYEIRIQPLKYWNTYMAEMIKPNSTAKNIPFEQFMWAEIASEIEDEVVNSVIGVGDTSDVSSNKAIRITNGFIKIINAASLTATATGAITATDVIDQFEAVYMDIPAKKRKKPMNLYCSVLNADRYDKRYRTLYHDKPKYNDFKQPLLDIGQGKCTIFPTEWMGDNDGIIIAPSDNMIMGTDSVSDMNTIEMIKTVYGFDCAIVFPIGLQCPDLEMLFINDTL